MLACTYVRTHTHTKHHVILEKEVKWLLHLFSIYFHILNMYKVT